ncbi:hypothetical protein OG422_05760 [Streptomyces sp. NBC_01525]|uniref:hypothetical protein n=1 Tax=Streptomyces sp. NBC_01525 TaxID=2903893 RepID=UPI00386B5B8A
MECEGELIDGIWQPCGCDDCQQAECDAIEADVEYGALTEDEALDLHYHNCHL